MISLFPHQQEALQETKDFDNIAVYHDMGLGKTFTGSEMMKRFGCKVNLIVCQKSKVQDWVEHFTDNYQMQVFDLTNDFTKCRKKTGWKDNQKKIMDLWWCIFRKNNIYGFSTFTIESEY